MYVCRVSGVAHVTVTRCTATVTAVLLPLLPLLPLPAWVSCVVSGGPKR